jgi:predicted transcriptional regulator
VPHKDRKDRLEYNREYHAKHRPSPKPVPQPDGLPPVGAVVFSADGRKVQCHACGRWFGSLNTHTKTHDLHIDAYRERYGLARTLSLWPPALQEKQRQLAIERGQGEIGKQFIPQTQGRKPGLEPRLSVRVAASRRLKGRGIKRSATKDDKA